MSFLNRIAIIVAIVLSFGIFGSWLTGIQEGRINQFQQEAEIRIGQIREECRRKLEAKSTEVKRDFDKHVAEKSKKVLDEQAEKHATEKKQLEDRIAQLVKRSDELQQKLESMAHHFKAYKEQMEEVSEQRKTR